MFITLRSDQLAIVAENSDATTYFIPAIKLLKQGSFLNNFDSPEISRTPGYPAFLAGIMILVGENVRRLLIAQTFILSLEVLFFYQLARRIAYPLTALVAGLVAAFSPWRAVLAGFPLTEGLFLMLLTLACLLLKITTESHSKGAAGIASAAAGLCTAAAVLVRPVWPLILLIAGAFFLLYGPARKGSWLLLSILLVFAALPVLVWKTRNQQVSHFNGLSDIAGQCASQMLGARVTAWVTDQNRWVLKEQARLAENSWKMSIQEQDRERWSRAAAVFRNHPLLTSYLFTLSGIEHALHPSPDVLSPPRLSFRGDYWILAVAWGTLLFLSFIGIIFGTDEFIIGSRAWPHALLAVGILLTMSSGLCFGQGSRYRVPLEMVVPLLAAAGLSRILSIPTGKSSVRDKSLPL
jgi:4-amino-4-deoxy-L-arabinose transferase-like glycosyltransferase